MKPTGILDPRDILSAPGKAPNPLVLHLTICRLGTAIHFLRPPRR